MAGARKLAELTYRLRRCTACASEKGMSLLCSLSKIYARHQVTERVLRFGTWQSWSPRLRSLLRHVVYFIAISWFGYVVLTKLKVRGVKPRGIDLFFGAVSAATVSSMTTVEMEVFSNAQLLVLTVLMFIGGEVFLSLVGLAYRWFKLSKQDANKPRRRVEAGLDMPPVADIEHYRSSITDDDMSSSCSPVDANTRLKRNAVRALFFIVLGILMATHVLGSVAIAAYIRYASPGSRRTLRGKALNLWTFAVFTTVSTFSSCGYMPTNENMVVFKRDTGLQMLLLPQALLGNTLFPPLLAACVRVAAALTRRVEVTEMARKDGRELTGYYHLFPARRCWMLTVTVSGFIGLQVALLCGMEWGGALKGMSRWEKASNALFLAVNSRHTGESTIDMSTIAPAILVLFVVMMYLPPYTTWFPFEKDSGAKVRSTAESNGTRLLNNIVLSQLSYLSIFVMAICITERKNLREDPLNFSVFSIVVEVVSAYGNVGFSMGYSCSRQINPEQLCTDRWTDFAGRWSDAGKVLLILVMVFGRLKKFTMNGGKTWKLS